MSCCVPVLETLVLCPLCTSLKVKVHCEGQVAERKAQAGGKAEAQLHQS